MESVVDLTTGGVMLREHQDLQRTVRAVPGHPGDGPGERALSGMVEFATTKGWTDRGGSLRARAEWGS